MGAEMVRVDGDLRVAEVGASRGPRHGECPMCLRDGRLLPVEMSLAYGDVTIRMCYRCRTGDAARWVRGNPWGNPADHLRHQPYSRLRAALQALNAPPLKSAVPPVGTQGREP